MADNFVLGMNAKLYFNPNDTLIQSGQDPDDVVWNEADNVKDLTLNLETGEADITTRANNGFRATAATLKDGSIEFQMNWKPSGSFFSAIQDAWSNSKEIALMALDGDKGTSGKQGLASNFTVTNFTRNEPLEEAMTVDVTLKPSSETQWHTVSS
jgi:hypothetical protein